MWKEVVHSHKDLSEIELSIDFFIFKFFSQSIDHNWERQIKKDKQSIKNQLLVVDCLKRERFWLKADTACWGRLITHTHTHTHTVCVIAGMVPISILAKERLRSYLARNGALNVIRGESIAEWQRRWTTSEKGRWTHRLIP